MFFSYEEASNQRHKIAFRPIKKDRTANIYNKWVYKKNGLVDEESRIYMRCRWTSSEDEADVSSEQTITS
ncbi:hypothetical protein DICVIV_13503 [Dictyocaulus viviparus]|uniref:Uncharacterized protein n=1 Tax=Dictyocaulus viviparus TaxID=29172 RepID=A0A0D8XDM0_DICVI|nr:hypothetical protein DICVIV_13503 [Dictyocaulus viviparus]